MLGYKNYENTEKISIFKKYDDKKPENTPSVTPRLSQSDP